MDLKLKNMLFANTRTNFDLYPIGGGASIYSENSTFANSTSLLRQGSVSAYSLTMTNCIFANITNAGFSGSLSSHLGGYNNGFYNFIYYASFGSNAKTSSSYPFLAAGAANYYLTSDFFRNAGNTNIDSALLANLQQKTTYPPLIYSNTTFFADMTFSPQAQRDTDLPDLGYHYDPIDYIADYCICTNSISLTINSGTVIAGCNAVSLWLQNGGSITSLGTPLKPNWLIRYQSVQEQSVLLDGSSPSGGFTVNAYHYTNTPPNGTFRFTKFVCPAGGGYHLYHYVNPYNFGNLLIQDCEFWDGNNYFGGNTNTVAVIKNSLFWRSIFNATGSMNNSLSISNNLFWHVPGKILIAQPGFVYMVRYNNVFDTCWIAPVPGKCNLH